MSSANYVWKEVPVKSMLAISGRIKTRVVPYRYEAGSSKFACAPDELRPDPTWKSYFVLICVLVIVTQKIINIDPSICEDLILEAMLGCPGETTLP
jgi:hypothetical protein